MADSCVNGGDTAFTLLTTVLVIGMVPGLAFFEAGLLRHKNSLSLIQQTLVGFGCLSVMWMLFGYSTTFGPSLGHVIGNPFKFFGLRGVHAEHCSDYGPSIPQAAFASFQMGFACITPLLVTGAYAERTRFRASLAFSVLFELLVYYPVAHWVWNNDGWLARLGTRDFAGGIVIHVTAGAASVVTALWVGRRHDFAEHHGEPEPSSLMMAAVGTGLLWTGWFGFNAGSSLAAGTVAAYAVLATQAAAATSTMTWIALTWLLHGKPTALSAMNGLVAGLAGVTPASGYIPPSAALVLGVILGFCSFFSVHILKGRLKLDDALDVSSVHGLTGAIGAIYTGFAGNKNINPAGMFLNTKLLGVAVAAAWSAFWSFILCVLISWLMHPYRGRGFRIGHAREVQGLDHSEFGEKATDPDMWRASAVSLTSAYGTIQQKSAPAVH